MLWEASLSPKTCQTFLTTELRVLMSNHGLFKPIPGQNKQKGIDQWFSGFLALQLFNMTSHAVGILNHKIIPFPLHNFNAATIRDRDINNWYLGYLICYPPPKVVETHRLKSTGINHFFF